MQPSDPDTFTPKPTISDRLASERTILANERTLLAYSRTALALVVSGMGFIEFSGPGLLRFISLLFIPLGLGTFLFGVFRFFKKKKEINRQRHQWH